MRSCVDIYTPLGPIFVHKVISKYRSDSSIKFILEMAELKGEIRKRFLQQQIATYLVRGYVEKFREAFAKTDIWLHITSHTYEPC